MNDLLHRMARIGFPPYRIAFALGLSLKTLLAQHGQEIQRAALMAEWETRETLFELAKSGQHPAVTVHWSKTYGKPEKPAPSKAKPPDPPVTPRLPRVRFIGPNGEIVT